MKAAVSAHSSCSYLFLHLLLPNIVILNEINRDGEIHVPDTPVYIKQWHTCVFVTCRLCVWYMSYLIPVAPVFSIYLPHLCIYYLSYLYLIICSCSSLHTHCKSTTWCQRDWWRFSQFYLSHLCKTSSHSCLAPQHSPTQWFVQYSFYSYVFEPIRLKIICTITHWKIFLLQKVLWCS